jgi:GntR family transcriptional regulator, transcriptional repressor for pyruvate dehydrogenase complex
MAVATTKRMSSRSMVERALRWNIGTGVWKPGEALPSERELAAELGVGRSTLRSAIEALRAEGLLVTSMGRNGRTRLAEPKPSEGAASLKPEARQDILYCFELRCAVEPAAAGLAAQRGTTKDFDRLRDILLHEVTTVRSYRALNSQFHIAVAEASGNPLITNVVAELCAGFFSWADALTADDAIPGDFADAHRPIYESLMTRDAVGAHDLVTAHLNEARNWYLERFDSFARNGHSTSSRDG